MSPATPLRVTEPEDRAGNVLAGLFMRARRSLRWVDYEPLLAHIDKRTLAAAYTGPGIGVLDIGIQSGCWRELFRGERAYTVPAFGTTGDLIDLIAFRLETPRSFWRFAATAPFLGLESIERAAFMGEPLMVHESPLEWLAAGGEGLMILDWEAYWPFWLDGVPALQFSDRSFAARATARLQRPLPLPPALVPAA